MVVRGGAWCVKVREGAWWCVGVCGGSGGGVLGVFVAWSLAEVNTLQYPPPIVFVLFVVVAKPNYS